jgi:alpha/beta superfamily hydrolase
MTSRSGALITVLGSRPGDPPPEGEKARSIVIQTDRGDIPCLYHAVSGGKEAVVWVWGYAGGYGGPANDIYKTMAEDLAEDSIASLRVHYRVPGQLEEAIPDTVAGVQFLQQHGYERIALVGHSFGGAVVISAAPYSDTVVAVVGLSSQTFGATGAAKVAPRALLLVHGTGDRRLPPYCSEQIYLWAQKPKELVLYPDAGHGLRECAEELRALLRRWLNEKLKGDV